MSNETATLTSTCFGKFLSSSWRGLHRPFSPFVYLSITFNKLSQLLTLPFTSLRKVPNSPPPNKSTAYLTSYLPSLSSLLLRWKKHLCSNQMEHPLGLSLPPPFASRHIPTLSSPDSLYPPLLGHFYQIRITCNSSSCPKKRDLKPSLKPSPIYTYILIIPVVLKRECVFESPRSLVG